MKHQIKQDFTVQSFCLIITNPSIEKIKLSYEAAATIYITIYMWFNCQVVKSPNVSNKEIIAKK